MNQYCMGAVVLSLLALVSNATAASTIGVVSTRGTVRVDESVMRGVANLKDGSSIRSLDTAVQVRLENGVHATLEPNSAMNVYGNRIEMLEGTGQIATKNGFELQALGFQVTPVGEKAVAKITFDPSGRVLVTAVEGSVNVKKGGLLLTRLEGGNTYFFAPESVKAGSVLPQSAARAAGKPMGQVGGAAAKTGVHWGVVSGVAAAGTGAAVGTKVLLDGDDVSR